MTDIALNEDERDCLQELMNISYGAATSAVAEIINQFATLNIPKIKTANTSEFKDYFEEKFNHEVNYFVANQPIDGTLSGENMFIMDESSTKNLAKEFGLEEEEMVEDELKDVILEITNIISATTTSKFSELIDAIVTFSPPSVKMLYSTDNIEDRYETEYKYVIIISTDLKFQEQEIHGELILMSKDESILFIKEALNRLIEEF